MSLEITGMTALSYISVKRVRKSGEIKSYDTLWGAKKIGIVNELYLFFFAFTPFLLFSMAPHVLHI